MRRLIYVTLVVLLATSLWARNNPHLCFRVKAPGGIITVFIDSDRRVCIEFQDAEGGAINEKEILSEL